MLTETLAKMYRVLGSYPSPIKKQHEGVGHPFGAPHGEGEGGSQTGGGGRGGEGLTGGSDSGRTQITRGTSITWKTRSSEGRQFANLYMKAERDATESDRAAKNELRRLHPKELGGGQRRFSFKGKTLETSETQHPGGKMKIHVEEK